MTLQTPLDHLANWLQSFDHQLLQTEDDVETKFVLPLFQHLGYPENCRRGKYPLSHYKPGGVGRKPEIDYIYFTTAEPEKQGPDTAIVIVEAKEPQESNLAAAVKQARFYSEYLTPAFLVITNGFQLKVLKRQRFRGDESVFDTTVEKLKNSASLTQLYEQLNFATVTQVKEQAANVQTHEQYVRLAYALRHYPDLQAILDQGDFTPAETQEGQRLRVVTPKVALTAELPLGFGEGSCQIEFSNITLRSLIMRLTHTDILCQFMVGLQTHPASKLRTFVQQLEDGSFQVELGQTIAVLSEIEVADLCKCVDKVGQAYKDKLIEAETLLETWDFTQKRVEDISGYYLLSVRPWLWELMKKFSGDFGYNKGKSEWHIFDPMRRHLRIEAGDTPVHTFIWPKPDHSFEPQGYLELIYEIPDWVFESETRDTSSWQQTIGPRGIWSARYTKHWLVNQFIPKLFSYYSSNLQVQRFDAKTDIQDEQISFPHIPLHEVTEPQQLEEYVHMVTELLGSGSIRRAGLLRPYYTALTELARHANPATFDERHVLGNLHYLDLRQRGGEPAETYHWPHWDYYSDGIKFLYQNVARINQVDYEEYDNLDFLTRAFTVILRAGTITCSQAELNAAKAALQPIWELYRFESRYVPSRGWF